MDSLVVEAETYAATVSWVERGTATDWEVELRQGDVVVTTTTASGIPSATLSSLEANTAYTVAVRPICGVGDTGAFRAMAFRTRCAALTSSDLPYFYDVEDATASGSSGQVDHCWTRGHVGGTTNYPYPSNTNAYNSTYAFYMYNNATVNKSWVALPQYSGDLNALSIGFWAYKASANYGRLKVGVMTDPTDAATFTQLASMQVSTTNTWEYFEVPLSAYTDTGSYVAIMSDSNSTNITYVDDITLMVTPLCDMPDSVTVSALAPTQITINIADAANNGTYLVQFSGDSTFSETIYTTTHTFFDLVPNSSYTIAVSSVCSDGNATAPVATVAHTPCLPYSNDSLPFVEDFESYTGASSSSATSRFDVDCWKVVDRYSANYPYVTTSNHFSGSNSLYFYTSTAHPTVVSLPLFEMPVSGLEMGFYARVATAGNSVQVGYMTNPDDPSTFVMVQDCGPSATSTWEEFIVEFPSQATGFIAFRKGTGITVYIDDIRVYAAPGCARLLSFEVSNITSDGGTVTINDTAMVNDYVINAINGEDTVHFYATSNVFTMTGLQPNMPYELEVYTRCSDGSTTAPRYDEFRTACAPVSTLPWIDDFENQVSSQAPLCWTSMSGNNTVRSSTTLAHSGTLFLDFRGTTTGNVVLFPSIDQDLHWSDMNVNFWTRPESTSASCGYFMLGYYTIDDNTGDTVFVMLDSINVADFSGTVEYINKDVSLANVPDNSVLAFVHMANGTGYYWYVDDVNLYLAPDCARAQGIDIADLTDTSFNVIIFDTNAVGNYVVTLANNTDTIVTSVTDTIAPFTGLTPNTTYEVSMVTECGDVTTLPHTMTVTTACVAVDSLPWSEDFNSYTGSTSSSATSRFDLPCWFVPYRSSANYPYFNNNSTYNAAGGNCVYVNTGTVVVLPYFGIAPEQLIMSLDLRVTSSSNGLEIGVVSNPLDRGSFVPVMSCVPDATGTWQNFTATFAGHSSGMLAVRTMGSVAYFDNIVVDALPACVNPSEIELVDIDSSSATIHITDANNSDHYWIYGGDQPIEVTGNDYQFTGLDADSLYTFYVRTQCATGLSEDSTRISFRTNCSVQSVPFFEDFNDLTTSYNSNNQGMIPCWNLNKNFPGAYMTAVISGTYSYDEGTLKFYPGNAAARTIAILPLFDQPISGLELTFQTRPEGTSSSAGSFDVGYITNPLVDTTFVVVDHYNYSDFSNAFQLKVVRFAGAPEGARIAMRHNAAASNFFWFVDDVDVHVAPSCIAPQAVAVSNITATGVTVTVTDTNDLYSYRCYFDNGTTVDTVDIVSSNTIIVNTLDPSSSYTLRVVGVCSDGTITSYVETSFNTLCGAISLPVFFDPNNYATGTSAGLPNCWHRINNATGTTNYYPYINSSSANAHSGSNVLYFYFTTATGYADHEVMVFPEIDTVNFPMNQIEVGFWAKSSTNNRKLVVGVLTNPDSLSTFQPIDTIRLTTTVSQYFVETGSFTGHGAYIGLMSYKDTNAYSYIYVDDISIVVGSPCSRSTNLTAANATTSTVDLGWTDGLDGFTQWKIRYAIDTVDVWTEVTANNNPFTLTGLNPNTIYRYVVAPVCADGQTAFFSHDTMRFSTSQVPAVVPYNYDFEAAAEWQNWQTASNGAARWYRGAVDTVTPGNNVMYLSVDGGQTNSWTPGTIVNTFAYRDIDFGAVEHNYSLSFYYRGGGCNEGNYDGVSVLLVDPAVVVGTPSSTGLDTPWGRLTTVHARRDTVGGTHNVLFDGVSGVRRLVFAFFQSATSTHTYTMMPPIIDSVSIKQQACERPYDLASDNVTPNSVSLIWSGDSAATYVIDYRPAGTSNTAGLDLFDTVTGLSHTVTGLPSDSLYSFWVRKICNDSTFSYWTTNINVRTLCGYAELPYAESFEGVTPATYSTAGQMPSCWTAYSNGTNANYTPHVNGSGSYWYPHTGTNAVTMTSGSGAAYGNTKIMALPPIQTSVNLLSMSFWYKMESATYGTLTVGYITDPDDPDGSYVSVATIPNTTTLTCDTVEFTNVTADVARIAFRWYHNSTYYSVGIDDITVWQSGTIEEPVCEAPVITASAATETTASFSWSGDASAYQVAIAAAWDSATVVPVSVTDTFHTFANLTAGTEYTLGVRAVCDAEHTSQWMTVTVTTDEHPCYTPTALTYENVTLNSAILGWTPGENETEWELHVTGTNYDQTITTSTNPYTLTGLTSSTTYSFSVRAVCSETQRSEWSDTVSFTTTTCQPVTGVSVSGVTTTTATVSWTAPAGVTSFEVEYGLNGFAHGVGQTVTATTNSITLSNLEASTAYDVYVRAICAEGVYSEFAGTASNPSFTTENEPTGIDDVDNSAVALYPNPATTSVTLSGIAGQATVSVVDMNGRVSGTWNVENGELTIDLTGYAQGAYFVRITGEQQTAIRKLIVK